MKHSQGLSLDEPEDADDVGACRAARSRHALPASEVVVYLADHSAIDGTTGLLRQKAVVEAGGWVGSAVSHYAVDSGAPSDGGPYGFALLALLDLARSGGLRAIVVADVGCLARDRSSAFLAAIAFAELGVRVIEAAETGAARALAARSCVAFRQERPRASVHRLAVAP